MITENFIKNIFKKKPKKGSPFILLYNRNRFEWRYVNALLWMVDTRTAQDDKTNYIKTHPFYIANPTSYGFLFGYLTFKFIKGFIHYMHTGVVIYYNLKFCFYWIIYLMLRWYVKIRRMSVSPYFYTPVVWQNMLIGMFLFIISEIMIFFAIFWAYFHSSFNPSPFIGGVWPPTGLQTLEWWRWPALSTVLLLYSGFTVNVFYYSVKTINIMSLRRAKNQIIHIRNYINADIKSPSIFIESKFSYKIFDKEISINELIKQIKRLTFIKIIKKKLKEIEWRWLGQFRMLKYELRQYAYIEQTWGLVYYRVRLIKRYRRYKFYNFKVIKSWIYCSFALQYLEWKLRYVYGGLFCTIIAGTSFLFCQKYEYSHASYNITDGIYGTVFYSITGLHGFHVFAGIVLLFFMFTRFHTSRKDFTRNFHPHTGFTSAVWYWHFVDIVWICVYTIVYIWGSLSV